MGLVHEVVDDRAIIIGTDGVELITLNPVGTLVWDLLDVARPRAAIVEGLTARFPDHDRAVIEQDVHDFLEELRSGGLVDVDR